MASELETVFAITIEGLLHQGSTVYAYMTKAFFVKAAFITWDHVQKDNNVHH